MTQAELLAFARSYRRGILGRRRSLDMCFIVHFPLQGLLEYQGEPCRLVAGFVGEHRHCWLEVGELTLDATADQFRKPNGHRMPPVYCGPRPSWYRFSAPRKTRKRAGR